MSEIKQVRVFILGAGCSAKYEYPLGIGLTRQLQEFSSALPNDFVNIREKVSNTIALMDGLPAIETLDQLAKHLEEEFSAHNQTEGQTDQQNLQAKIATSAMFLAREQTAKKKDLRGYIELNASIFGGDAWQTGIQRSDAHILSFNYDRLFEIAFQRYSPPFDPKRIELYSDVVLSSGFNPGNGSRYERVQIGDNRFCLLKLHGSAGRWVKFWRGNEGIDECRLYHPACPDKIDNPSLQDIETCIQKQKGHPQPWEPLIAFPHERQRARLNATKFAWDAYLRKVGAHASKVLSCATDVRIIGYSFAPIDSRYVVNDLLNKIPPDSRIIVQNMDVATVRTRLEAYPTMRDRIAKGRVEFDPTPF